MKSHVKTMMKTTLAIAVVLAAVAFTGKQKTPLPLTTLKINVTGVRTTDGEVHLLVFNKAVGFPTNDANAYRHVKQKAAIGQTAITVPNVPYGKYAVVAFHDVNNNQRFDRSWFGSPKEDYGFSNLPVEFCGTPSFQQTAFEVNAQADAVNVKLVKAD